MEETWRIIIGLIIAGIGGFVAVGTLVGLRSVKRSAAWPQVKGNVLASSVVESHSQSGTSYRAEVKYEYAVDGVHYTSDRIKFGWQKTRKRATKATAERYPAGSSVRVYYNPRKPSSSVLERETDRGSNISAVLFALLFVGGGIYMLLSGLFGD